MSDESSFEKRRETFEAGFAHSEEIEFRVQALRNRKLGIWAADLIGLKGAQADDYVNSLVETHINATDKDAILDKVITDFDAFQVECTDRTIRRKMEDLLVEARAEIMQAPDSETE